MSAVRKHARARTPGTTAVVVAPGNQSSILAVENLSASGALLSGAIDVAPGTIVQLLLSDGGLLLTLVARVTRVMRQRLTVFAVAFQSLGTDEKAQLDGLVRRTLERQRRECPELVLLVGVEPELSVQLEHDLADQGSRSVFASTSLEAIWQLEDAARRFGVAIVEFDREPSAACDLLVHLIVRHRHIRRILLSRHEPRKLARETSSWRAHACLQTPWTAESLAHVLVPTLE